MMIDFQFMPQKGIVYNKYLPYYERLQVESVEFFAEIKYNLGRAVLLQEIHPGLLIWCTRLDKYLNRYGRNFSKEDHVTLIKLLYQLFVIPDLEAQCVKGLGYILHKLLKKRYLLTRDDLQLPWRPLHKLVESVRYSNLVKTGVKKYHEKFVDTLNQVIRFARCYFPVEATEEMLLEWRPYMCPHDDESKRKAGYYFSKFLPAIVPVEHHHRGFKLWLSEFINYWFTCVQSQHLKTLADDYARLFTRVAERNTGYVDWNPYLPKIFNQFLSGLNLPVNGAAYKGNPRYQVITMNNYAKWFTYMIGGKSLLLEHLEKFFVAVESFYHPSNHGKYSNVLLGFLQSLTVHFVKRLHHERFAKPSWIVDVMESAKITDAEIEKFVMIVREVTLFSVYNKSGSYQAASVIQNLALLRADLILPSLLDRTYEALETLVEPHQVTATLNCITSVARVLVTGGDHLPSAPTHILRLLYLVLPGIDPNDFRKSMSSFTLISSIIGLIPLVDCTPALSTGIEMSEIERELCHASAQFEDFILQFIDRCFVLIEMSTAEEIAEQDNLMIENMNAQENMLGMGMLSTIQTMLMQSSPTLFESILNCIFRFISSRVLEVSIAGKMVSDICRAAVKANPVVTLKRFLPYMYSIVKNLATVPGIQDEDYSDSKLLWYLEMLSELVRCAGEELVPYKDMLKEIINLTLHLKCKKAYSRAGKLLKAVLTSCSSIYVTEWRSISKGFEESPEKHFYIRDWGKAGDVNNLDIHWHIPSLDELAFVNELLQDFLLSELEVMRTYINGSSITRDELHQRLQIIGACISGSSSVLPVWKNEHVNGQEPFSLLACHQFDLVTTVPELELFCPCITRKEIAMVIHQLFEYMLENNENDTKAFCIIAKIYNFIILHHGVNIRDYNIRWKTSVAVKKALADQLHGNKLHLRAILIERVQLQHDARVISKRLSRVTVMDKMVLDDLLILSTSDYTEVRIDSQKVLFGCFEALEFSCRSILPTLLSNLKPEESVSHEKLKGTLYILLSSPALHLITHFCEFMKKIWPAIVKSDQSEKTSIVSLINRLIRQMESKYETLSFKRMVNEESKIVAEQLLLSKKPVPRCYKTLNDPNSTVPSQALLTQGGELLNESNKENIKYYEDLTEELLSFIEDPKLHWRSCELCAKMLSLVLNHEYNASEKLVKVFVNLLVHDSLRIRSVAIKVLAVVLEQQKRKLPKRVIQLSNYGVDPSPQNLLTLNAGDNRSDNKWLQYQPDDAPHSQQDLDDTIYIDKTYIGYYSWPSEVKTYESHSILCNFECNIDKLNDIGQIIYTSFSDKDFLDNFFKFISLEKKKGEDRFHQHNFRLFIGLFRNFQWHILQKFENKMIELLDGNIESKHRCFAEVLAGLIAGSKNWNYEQLTYMWNFVGPLLRKTFSINILPEMLHDWSAALRYATENRDPNRLHQLYNILLDNPVCGDGGSLGDSSRLYILQVTVSGQEWRVSQIYHRILDYLLPHLSHPFKIVRDRIGSLLSYLFIPDMNNDFFTPTLSPHIDVFVDYVIEDLIISRNEVLEMDRSKDKESSHDVEMVEEGDTVCLTVKNGKLNTDDGERKRRDNLAKAVLSFLLSLSFGMQPISRDVYRLIQVLIPFEAREDDPEIANFCKMTFPRLSSKQIPLDLIESAVESIITVCNLNSWNARKYGLNYLKNMIYHNLFTFNGDKIKNGVQELVLNRLKDEQLEIREIASSLLSGLVHFGYVEVTKELLNEFISMACQKVRKIRYGVQLSPEEQQNNVVALRLKHGGILGLSACVLAFPYDVPAWIPETLLEVGKYLHGSPQVQEAVKKTLSEFRRTHHDNWHMHRQKFTDDQLTLLTDLLISPSYYA